MQQSLGPHVARCCRQTASQAAIQSSPFARPLSCSKTDSLHGTRTPARRSPDRQLQPASRVAEERQQVTPHLMPSARADWKYASYRCRLMGQHFAAVFRKFFSAKGFSTCSSPARGAGGRLRVWASIGHRLQNSYGASPPPREAAHPGRTSGRA